MSEIEWKLANNPPIEAGWYLGALNPANHTELSTEEIKGWRKKFGTTKVWFNPTSSDKWFEPDAHGYRTKPVNDRITHWAEIPLCPEL